MWAFTRSPTRPFHHTGGAGVWAFSSSSTRHFPLTHKGWCVGICHLAHTPVSSPTPKLPLAMCFALYMATALVCFISRWQLSLFLPELSVATYFAGYTATSLVCLQADGNSLFFNRTCCFAMSFCSATRQLPSVSRWQLLRFSNHGNCSKPDHTWQLPSGKPDHTWQQPQLPKNGIWNF